LNHPNSSWRIKWEKRWGLWIASPLFVSAVVAFVYRVTSFLSEELLFYLKLGSFIITATLGMNGAGVV
jgi:hypothetical protein